MSQVMFPRSSHAMPKTQTEQYATENKDEKPLPAGDGTMNYQDAPDEPGDEMAKDARVWRTYVRETDKWDKEMVEGRNNSLDVLLTLVSRLTLRALKQIEFKAALFSAISTAFVIESLGDLKPDPTESSSQTLLLMSQTLIAISNGQPAQLSDQTTVDATFTPSRTAVVVNLLWFLSLSLSVAVSLIAMLAKEWCYTFMSRRSGPMYEQARRRQERWNGIERWKMKQVLTYLPGLMHIALLLFATGLSIYLWDINVRVAVPVVVMTAGASLVYVCTTLLPLLDDHCPYASPLTFLLLDFHHIAIRPIHPIRSIRAAAFSLANLLYMRTNEPKWLESALEQIRDVMEPGNQELKDHSVDMDVPMDIVTSQMLSWMVINCEDSRSVDIALKALAGSTTELPYGPLVESGVIEAASTRIHAQMEQWNRTPEHSRFTDQSLLSTTVVYSRLYSLLVTGGTYTDSWDRWDDYLPSEESPRLTYSGYHVVQVNAWAYWCGSGSILEHLTSKECKPHDMAVAVAAALPLCHWDSQSYRRYISDDDDDTATTIPTVKRSILQIKQTAPSVITSQLQRHLDDKLPPLSTGALQALVESSAHYLIGLYPREEPHDSQRLLPVLLARLFIAQNPNATRLRRTIAITLAASAFATITYPGGDQPSQDTESREKRAIQVLRYYRTNLPDENNVCALFLFGFFGLLPLVDFTAFGENVGTVKDVIDETIWTAYPAKVLAYTLPTSYEFMDHIAQVTARCLVSVSTTAFTLEAESCMVTSCLSHMTEFELYGSTKGLGNLYIPALVALCHAQSSELQDFCLAHLHAQSVPIYSDHLLATIDKHKLTDLLYGSSVAGAHQIAPVAALHFTLLVAICVFSPQGSFDSRRAILEPLVRREDFSSLVPSHQDRRLPNLSEFRAITRPEVFSHSFASGVSRDMMQLVVDFFHADVSQTSSSGTQASDSSDLDLNLILTEMKSNFESLVPNVEQQRITNTETTANPCWPHRETGMKAEGEVAPADAEHEE